MSERERKRESVCWASDKILFIICKILTKIERQRLFGGDGYFTKMGFTLYTSNYHIVHACGLIIIVPLFFICKCNFDQSTKNGCLPKRLLVMEINNLSLVGFINLCYFYVCQN